MNDAIKIWTETDNLIKSLAMEEKEEIQLLKTEIINRENSIQVYRNYLYSLDKEDFADEAELLQIKNYNQDRIKSNLLEIQNFIGSPFFSNIIFNNGNYYISKFRSDLQRKIVLFTSPIARIRFSPVGEKYTNSYGVDSLLVGKELIKIEQGDLKEIAHQDKTLNFIYDGSTIWAIPLDKDNDIEVKSEDLTKREAHKKFTTNSKKVHESNNNKYVLGEIISTMRQEQDEIMRAPIDGVTLIKGVAGSGKTNIGFHRLVYLIKEFPERFKEDNIAVFCFNIGLKIYLKNILTDLNIEKVKVFSIDKWIRDIVISCTDIRYIHYSECSAIKHTDQEIISYIHEFLINKSKILLDKIGTSIRILPLNLVESEKKSINNIISSVHEQILNVSLITSLKNKIKETYISYESDGPTMGISAISKKDDKRRKSNDKLIDDLFNMVTKEFFKSNKTINLKLLKDFLEERTKTSLDSINNNEVSSYMANVLAWFIFYLNPQVFNKFDHIFVDEVQDLRPFQLILLNNIHYNSMTLDGDIRQNLWNSGVKKWEGLSIKVDNVYELKLSHRTSLQNMLFALEILENKDEYNAEGLKVTKKGDKPMIITNTDQSTLEKNVINLITRIKEGDDKVSIAILLPSIKYSGVPNRLITKLKENRIKAYIAQKERWEYSNLVHIATYQSIKGLEFDYVVLLQSNYFDKTMNPNAKNILFTAITRSKLRTFIFTDNTIPKIFNKVDSSYYELNDLENL